MALIKRDPIEQPVLMNVSSGVVKPKPTPAQTARKRIEQHPYWPSVTITSDAQERLNDLEIQFSSMGRAMQLTIGSLVEAIRTGQMTNSAGFSQTSLMPMDDLPSDITIVYQHSKDAVVIVDVRRPNQPSLF